jgi:hypothetical protein
MAGITQTGKLVLSYTPVPEEVRSASQVVFKEVFNDTRWEGYNLMTGVTHGQQIVIADDLGLIGKKLNGCTPQEVGQINLSDKAVTPVLIGGRFSYCAADENHLNKILKSAKNTFKDFFKRNKDEAEMSMIAGLLMQSLKASIEPKVWFSDKQAKTVANGGAFTNGTDLELFNQFDGFFKQIFGSSEVKHIEIAENNGANYGEQELTPEKAYNYVKDVIFKAPMPLRSDVNAEIKVTGRIYDLLGIYLAESAAGNGGLTKAVIDGVEVIKLYGRKIVPMYSWDETIMNYQNDGTKYFKPNRIVFANPSDLVIGTIDKESLTMLDYIYDAVGKKNLLDFAYHLDAKIVRDGRIAVAY